MHLPFPIGLNFLRAAGFALLILIGGVILFRFGVQAAIRRMYGAEPEHAQRLISRLVSPYWILLILTAANAFRGLFGSQIDWWLGAILPPAAGIFTIEALRLGVADYLLKFRTKHAVPKILRDILFGLIYATTALAYLGTTFKIDLTPLLTTSAILSVVIGMALQDTLGNLFAGVAINLDPPFKLGDWISLDGRLGQVVEITWRATKIVTLENELRVIPNNLISKAELINYQVPAPYYGELIDFGCPYEVSPSRVREIAMLVAAEIPGVRKDPAPTVQLLRFDAYSIVYRVKLWLDNHGESNPIRSHFQELLWYRFQREKIDFPYPQQEIRHSELQSRHALKLQQNREALQRVDILACMGPGPLEQLAEKASVICYAAGERIFRQGDTGNSLFVIKRGMVSLSLDQHGSKHTRPFTTLGEGNFFGEMSLLTGDKRSASARAAADCELVVIEHHQLAPLLEQHSDFLRLISEAMTERSKKLESTRANLERHVTQLEAAVPAGETEAEAEPGKELLGRIRGFFKLG